MPPVCSLPVVTGFDAEGAPAPDALWRLDTDPGASGVAFERGPGVVNPFAGLEPVRAGVQGPPEALADPGQLFFLAGEPRPAAFFHTTTGRMYLVAPPTGPDQCHYWHPAGGAPACPAAPVCPYRRHVVRLAPVATDHPDAVGAVMVPRDRVREHRAGEGPAPGWNLFPVHDPGRERLRRPEAWADPGTPDVRLLPPVEVGADAAGFFGRPATRLRQALLRPAAEYVRADVLVRAIDLPGVREAAAGGWLASLDLRETFPPLHPGAPATVGRELVVRLRPDLPTDHAVAAWRAAYAGGTGPLGAWLRDRLAREGAPAIAGLRWEDAEPAADDYAPVEPPSGHYAAELPGPDAGAALPAARAAVSALPDAAAVLPLLGDPADGREHLKRTLFALTLDRVPGQFLRPPDVSPWPGQLFEWWLTRNPAAAVAPVARTRAELLQLLATTPAAEPVRLATSRLGRDGPVRFVLGRSAPGRSADPAGADWRAVLTAAGGG